MKIKFGCGTIVLVAFSLVIISILYCVVLNKCDMSKIRTDRYFEGAFAASVVFDNCETKGGNNLENMRTEALDHIDQLEKAKSQLAGLDTWRVYPEAFEFVEVINTVIDHHLASNQRLVLAIDELRITKNRDQVEVLQEAASKALAEAHSISPSDKEMLRSVIMTMRKELEKKHQYKNEFLEEIIREIGSSTS